VTIRGVIFDCDGTLVDSEPLTIVAIAREAARLGVEGPLEADLDAMKGQSMANCLGMVESRFGSALPADFEQCVRATMVALFREHLQPMPGALELVSALRIPCCVATNGPSDKAHVTLELAGLLPRFEGRIFSAYDVGSWKPDPGLFLHAAAAMGVLPQHCAVVEDSESGMLAGIAAGMSVYAVRTAHPLPKTVEGRVTLVDRLIDVGRVIGLAA
jgi:HAD superfamily hydrolase (TIGR01509 family)